MGLTKQEQERLQQLLKKGDYKVRLPKSREIKLKRIEIKRIEAALILGTIVVARKKGKRIRVMTVKGWESNRAWAKKLNRK